MTDAVQKREILISGFLREIKDSLSFKFSYIFPESLHKICCLFYSIPIKIFMHSSTLDCMYSIDIYNNDIVKLSKKNTLDNSDNNDDYKKYKILQSCYIDSIPNIIQDGILYFIQNIETEKIVSSLALFDNNNKYDLSIFNESELGGLNAFYYPPCDNLIDCNNDILTHHSVIYGGHEGNLYELNLENFTSTKQINVEQDVIFDELQRYGQELSLSYLYCTNKLFGILCGHVQENYDSDSDDWFKWEITEDSYIKKAKCGLFDLIENKWTYIADYEYQGPYAIKEDKYYFKVGICKYNYYDLDNVYTVSDNIHIHKYNISKNKWITLREPNINTYKLIQPNAFQFRLKGPNVWFDNDPHILYYEYEKKFNYIDLRNNKIQSIQINNINNYHQFNVFL